MWIFTIGTQYGGNASTTIYRIGGDKWETVGSKLYKTLKALGPHNKVGYEVAEMDFETFEQFFSSDGEAVFKNFHINTVHPNDDHWIP
jgi:hypothetical protein